MNDEQIQSMEEASERAAMKSKEQLVDKRENILKEIVSLDWNKLSNKAKQLSCIWDEQSYTGLKLITQNRSDDAAIGRYMKHLLNECLDEAGL